MEQRVSFREWLGGQLDAVPDEGRFVATITVWGRWIIWLPAFAYTVGQPDFSIDGYLLYLLMHTCFVLTNATLHWRLVSARAIDGRWLLALFAVDTVNIMVASAGAGGLQPIIFLAFYPSLAAFAAVLGSPSLTVLWTSLVAGLYATVVLTIATGPEFDEPGGAGLVARIIAMFGVAVPVALIARRQRIGWQGAVAQAGAMHRERIELSQRIHDTSAQSVYMIGMGIENAMSMVGGDQDELRRTLSATSELSRAAMWELRQPVDLGPIYEGQPLSSILTAHARSFTTITSVPAELVRLGTEPPLETGTRAGLLSIAHNGLTNAHRHARASAVTVELEFGADSVRLSVRDDGVGLPDDYGERGHGFRNMRAEAERLGGELIVESSSPDEGTTVTCLIPVARQRTGA